MITSDQDVLYNYTASEINMNVLPWLQNPSWNQPFSFIVTKEHNYLNVCVWSRVIDESCDVLIGHVSLYVVIQVMCTYYVLACIWSRINMTLFFLPRQVTVPVMDIALECLCTSSGYHGRRYVLVAAQTLKPSVR